MFVGSVAVCLLHDNRDDAVLWGVGAWGVELHIVSCHVDVRREFRRARAQCLCCSEECLVHEQEAAPLICEIYRPPIVHRRPLTKHGDCDREPVSWRAREKVGQSLEAPRKLVSVAEADDVRARSGSVCRSDH